MQPVAFWMFNRTLNYFVKSQCLRFEPVGNGCNRPEGQSGLIRWRIRPYGANWSVSGICKLSLVGWICCGFYCNILVTLLLAVLKSHISHGGKKLELWYPFVMPWCNSGLSYSTTFSGSAMFQCWANCSGHCCPVGNQRWKDGGIWVSRSCVSGYHILEISQDLMPDSLAPMSNTILGTVPNWLSYQCWSGMLSLVDARVSAVSHAKFYERGSIPENDYKTSTSE